MNRFEHLCLRAAAAGALAMMAAAIAALLLANLDGDQTIGAASTALLSILVIAMTRQIARQDRKGGRR